MLWLPLSNTWYTWYTDHVFILHKANRSFTLLWYLLCSGCFSMKVVHSHKVKEIKSEVIGFSWCFFYYSKHAMRQSLIALTAPVWMCAECLVQFKTWLAMIVRKTFTLVMTKPPVNVSLVKTIWKREPFTGKHNIMHVRITAA